MLSESRARRLLALFYVAGLLLLIDQASEILATMYPAKIGVLTWRFGAVGLILGRVSSFLIADVLILCAAIALGHRAVVRGLAWLHLVLAVGIAAVLVLFALDTVQVRLTVQPGARRGVYLAVARTLGIGLLTIATLLTTWLVSLRATAKPRTRQPVADNLLMGAPAAARAHED